MSGGSLNYICYSLAEVAGELRDRELDDLVQDLSKVLHDAEWWLSRDIGEESYREKARKFKEKWFKESREERLRHYIDEIFDKAKQECLNLIGVNVSEES